MYLFQTAGMDEQTSKVNTHTGTTMKTSLLSAQHWWKATHCVLQSHLKMSWRHAATSTVSLSLSVSPVESREGETASGLIQCGVLPWTRPEGTQSPSCTQAGYLWHKYNEAIWLRILFCMSINPQMSTIQTKESYIFEWRSEPNER